MRKRSRHDFWHVALSLFLGDLLAAFGDILGPRAGGKGVAQKPPSSLDDGGRCREWEAVRLGVAYGGTHPGGSLTAMRAELGARVKNSLSQLAQRCSSERDGRNIPHQNSSDPKQTTLWFPCTVHLHGRPAMAGELDEAKEVFD